MDIIRTIIDWLNGEPQNSSRPPSDETAISINIEHSIADIKRQFASPEDIEVRDIEGYGSKAAVLYIVGIADQKRIATEIILPLGVIKGAPSSDYTRSVENTCSNIKICKSIDDIVTKLLSGYAVVLCSGKHEAAALHLEGFSGRNVGEVSTENSIRGSKEAFIEDLQSNVSMVRKRLRTPNFGILKFTVGFQSQTPLVVLYLKGTTSQSLIDEISKRINNISVDGIFSAGEVEQFIEDNWLSPFPQFIATERPDRVAAALVEGQIALIVSGTPTAIIAPATLNTFMLAPDDYFERWPAGTAIRLLRFLSFPLALFLPGLFVAVLTFHPGFLPSGLLMTIISTRMGVPFAAYLEALLMEASLELIREAGLRLPRTIAQTIGVVGGIVIGQAAVSAGIVSPLMVITVAVTALSTFTIPNISLSYAVRTLRFLILFASATLGIYGLVMSGLLIVAHLAQLQSLGTSYLAPWAPLRTADLKDALVRAPVFLMKKKPQHIKNSDGRR